MQGYFFKPTWLHHVLLCYTLGIRYGLETGHFFSLRKILMSLLMFIYWRLKKTAQQELGGTFLTELWVLYL